MIISHLHKFIFIKTHKTAGSSMEMALARHCGPDDIITPMEANAASGLPRNFYENTCLARTYARCRWFRKLLNRHSPLLGAWYYEHMPATRVRELIGEATWKSYYKFCFERNPWEKVASYYCWKKYGQGRKLPAFRTYVLAKAHRLPRDANLYFNEDVCLLDEVHDFSGFQQTFAGICARLGLPFDGKMPREKTGITQVKPNYQNYYDGETREKIAALFSREIRHMGYTFDQACETENTRGAV